MEKKTIKNNGQEVKLTDGEMEIHKTLLKLGKLWKKHGKRLTLFNGNSLRISGIFNGDEIFTYTITGDGGDGGDLT